MLQMSFDHDKGIFVSTYRISRDKDIVHIWYKNYPRQLQNPDFYEMILNVRNIPALLKGILEEFYPEPGWYGNHKIDEYGDQLMVSMDYSPHLGKKLKVFNFRKDVEGIANLMSIHFTDYHPSLYSPEERVPTRDMVGLSDMLKKIYDEWEEEQKK